MNYLKEIKKLRSCPRKNKCKDYGRCNHCDIGACIIKLQKKIQKERSDNIYYKQHQEPSLVILKESFENVEGLKQLCCPECERTLLSTFQTVFKQGNVYPCCQFCGKRLSYDDPNVQRMLKILNIHM